ncbi:hypothetical protein SE37_08135 [Geobacter soli]|uniref:Uncharacterized protein n=1 Tax=Geobacter soli TaxID=1510391 RepID=A0A0C1QPP9_9BACT|nr:hypothetical protein SE37_08135 [Geobacter soli]
MIPRVHATPQLTWHHSRPSYGRRKGEGVCLQATEQDPRDWDHGREDERDGAWAEAVRAMVRSAAKGVDSAVFGETSATLFGAYWEIMLSMRQLS